MGAFEVKLGNRDETINAAALNLKALARRVETLKAGHPAVLGVGTGSGYPYTRPDGVVVVVPIGHLGPYRVANEQANRRAQRRPL